MRAGDGQTPLHVAPTVAIAEFLLDHGADIDARDVDHESTPAQYLVRSHPDVARYLVERGAHTDILMAAALGDLERVRGFLDADPESIRCTVSQKYFPKRNPHAGGHIYTWTLGQGKTAHAVARELGHEEVLRLLMDRSPDALKLAVACELGDDASVAALLQARPDLAQTLDDDERRKLPSRGPEQQRRRGADDAGGGLAGRRGGTAWRHRAALGGVPRQRRDGAGDPSASPAAGGAREGLRADATGVDDLRLDQRLACRGAGTTPRSSSCCSMRVPRRLRSRLR